MKSLTLNRGFFINKFCVSDQVVKWVPHTVVGIQQVFRFEF